MVLDAGVEGDGTADDTFDGDLTDAQPSGNDGTFHSIMGLDPVFVEGYDETVEGAVRFDGLDQNFVEAAQNKGLPIYANPAYSVCLWVNGPPAQQAGMDSRDGHRHELGDENRLFPQ